MTSMLTEPGALNILIDSSVEQLRGSRPPFQQRRPPTAQPARPRDTARTPGGSAPPGARR